MNTKALIATDADRVIEMFVMKMAGKKLTLREIAGVVGCNLPRAKVISSGRAAKLKPAEMRALVQKLHFSAHWILTGEGSIFDAASPHQEEGGYQFIVDRIAAMNIELQRAYHEAYKAQEPEFEQLRAQCAQLGHIFRRKSNLALVHRRCACCGSTELDSKSGAV